MISIYVFPVFLWVCLCVQAQPQGPPFKIRTVSRVDKGDSWQLSVELEGTAMEEWHHYGRDGKKRVIKAYEPLNSETGKTGTVNLEVKKGKYYEVFLNLYAPSRLQHFLLVWNLRGNGSVSQQLDLSLAVVSPSADVVYVPNEATHVTITVEENRGNGHLSWNPHLLVSSAFQKGQTVDTSPKPHFMEESIDSHDGLRTMKRTFREEENATINGYISTTFMTYPTNINLNWPLSRVQEHCTTMVHEQNTKGPFRDDFISAKFDVLHGMYTCQIMPFKEHCTLYCTSFGNDIQSVEIKKMTHEGEVTQASDLFREDFKSMAIATIDAQPDGTHVVYACVATSKNGNVKKDYVLVSYEHTTW